MTEIQIEGKVDDRIPRAHVRTRLQRLLRRLPWETVIARVRFADVNGPKGGNDVRCALVVEFPRQPAIRVERLAPTSRLAFEASVDRLTRRLQERRERGQDSRRHPKKYYAARRLL